MKQRLLLPVLVAVVGFCSPAPAAAQQPAPAPDTIHVVQAAENTREQLRNVLRTYPDSVAEILRRDPSLMSRADYIEPYPQLTKFLAQNPELARIVEYYLAVYTGLLSRTHIVSEYTAHVVSHL